MDYLNFGDALSPVMVALLAGRPIRRVPTNSQALRLAAVGTIGHGFANGEVWFWGTGCSAHRNPSAPMDQREPFIAPGDGSFIVEATRGPVSERLLNGAGNPGSGVYGDPVWLLPRVYRPSVPKKWKLGVILHLSELNDRTYTAVPRPNMIRFDVPAEFEGDVHLITTVTPLGVVSLKDKVDEILACERIVSTSLHGMVIAESYGIPCLYFSPGSGGMPRGLADISLDPDGPTDLRIVDLYRGLAQPKLAGYSQPRGERTDWADVMAAIDRTWEPKTLDEDALVEAFPIDLDPLTAPEGGTIWDNPVLTELQLKHDVAELRRLDKLETKGLPPRTIVPPDPKQRLKSRLMRAAPGTAPSLPVSWVATTSEHPYANLGDALSALVVATMAGLPVRRAGFDQPIERIVAVGTIGHAQRRGILHFWGTGLDATRNTVDNQLGRYVKPPETSFTVHATRGPKTAEVLRAEGIKAPAVYGDPVWVLPRIWPFRDEPKTHELGVILHISEYDAPTPEAAVLAAFKRYEIPAEFAGRIKLINTWCEPTPEAMREKVREIVSCQRILSTSLHGLVISETYGIPCAWFAPFAGGPARPAVDDPSSRIDHRMRDFYAGAGADSVLTFRQDRGQPSDWAALIAYIDAEWKPLSYDPAPLIAAFPLPLAVPADGADWPLPEEIVGRIPF
ncbi:polysaccharide pyruvyl transferase family protein [Methylobrevis sp. L22]|uniref:Polysaccharide pyruvyl transferase family protein n=2 Tax=Methylobrevis albus TaxID=2793297 RepID=A0A931I0S8_9HYPH|nr:polysaccharide pyruvyl transferase family protein [Methylobrevis albus]